MSGYPAPDKLALPPADEPTADQQYYVGWLVQHNRLWLLVLGLTAIVIALGASLITFSMREKPPIQVVTLDGGYLVTWNERGQPVIDGVEYVAPRLRAAVESFIENRYAYDWQNLHRFNSALRLMSTEAAEREKAKIQELNPAANIYGVRLKASLALNWSEFKVVAKGEGIFEVTVTGLARINDAIRHTDPNNPAVRDIVLTMTVRTVPATETNPLGYVITATGRDIL